MNLEPYVIIELERIELIDATGDGRVDIVLQVTTRAGSVTKEQLSTCTEPPSLPKGLPAPAQERLVYVSRNDDWLPTAVTRRLLDRLYAARTAYRARDQ